MEESLPALSNNVVMLEPASEQTVDLLVRWPLDPIANGAFKRVSPLAPAQLRALILQSPDRQYFLVRLVSSGLAVGRFYWRAWLFSPELDCTDYELNILIAEPGQRGRGVGTAVQSLAVNHLLSRRETRSVFAYTHVGNYAERRALARVGLQDLCPLPHPYYRVPEPGFPCILFAATCFEGRCGEQINGAPARGNCPAIAFNDERCSRRAPLRRGALSVRGASRGGSARGVDAVELPRDTGAG